MWVSFECLMTWIEVGMCPLQQWPLVLPPHSMAVEFAPFMVVSAPLSLRCSLALHPMSRPLRQSYPTRLSTTLGAKVAREG